MKNKPQIYLYPQKYFQIHVMPIIILYGGLRSFLDQITLHIISRNIETQPHSQMKEFCSSLILYQLSNSLVYSRLHE